MNLAMLMNTVMLTGYMFKSAEERFRLRSALGIQGGGASGGAGAGAAQQLQQQPQQQQMRQQQAAGAGGGALGAGGGVLGKQYAPGVQKSRVQVGSARARLGLACAYGFAWQGRGVACCHGGAQRRRLASSRCRRIQALCPPGCPA
jgi:hypothetical protein